MLFRALLICHGLGDIMVGESNPLKNFVDVRVQSYCLDHSTSPSIECEAIASYSEEFVPHGFMVSGPEVGSLIAFMARTVRAKRILEIGCFTGYSALVLAETLPDDGELVTLDINEETTRIAREMSDRSPARPEDPLDHWPRHEKSVVPGTSIQSHFYRCR